MSGKRLLDLATLFNASRGVAQKHIALRTRQVEVYNRTSSITRAVRNQTKRVTETAKAASFLASRLNESAPTWTSEVQEDKESGGPIPSRHSTRGNSDVSQRKGGLEQDHFYKRSLDNSAVDVPPNEDLHIAQEKAFQYPLPDGTIPPGDSDLNTPNIDHDIVPTRQQNEPSKDPLVNGGLRPSSPKKSSIPSPISRPLSADAARAMQRHSELQIPSKTADSVGESSIDPLEKSHDEDSFYVRSGHTSPALSSLPRVKIPEYPSSTQKGDPRLTHDQFNSDSYYSVEEARIPEQTYSTARGWPGC
jgi:aarF domain-containing kinase